MARILAIDWDHQQLHVVLATAKHTTVTVHRAAVSNEDLIPNPATAEALGQRLGEVLKSEGIAPAPVVVSVGRDRVILKEILYPPVPATEEPAVVRFQVLKELTHAPEEVVVDYFPTGDSGPKGERRALVLILRKELLQSYEVLCKAAGLKLLGVAPRSFGTAACLARFLAAPPAGVSADLASAPVAVLTLAQNWGEFCVVRNGTLLFARAMAAPSATTENALLGEIRRNLAVYAGQSPNAGVRALFVADSGAHTSLRELLQNTLAIPVHQLDPFMGSHEPAAPVDRRGAFAGPLGLLASIASQKVLPINFAKPKEPVPERDPNKYRIAVAAAVAGILLLGGAVAGYLQVAALDSDLQALYVAKAQVDATIAVAKEDSARIKAIGDWVTNDICWLDELYDLTERFPDSNGIRLTQMSGNLMTRSAKSKYVGRMELKGITTTEYQLVDSLVAHLVEDSHFRVEPKVLSRNAGVDRLRYAQQFSTKMEMEPRPPSAYTLVLEAKPPEREEDTTDEQGGAALGGLGGFGGFGGGMGGQGFGGMGGAGFGGFGGQGGGGRGFGGFGGFGGGGGRGFGDGGGGRGFGGGPSGSEGGR